MRWRLLLAILVATSLLAQPALAQTPNADVLFPSVSNRFPDGLVFSLRAESAQEITKVGLTYRLRDESKTVSPQFSPGKRLQVEYALGNRNEGTYLYPSIEISYQWSIEDAAGNKQETAPQTAVYYDSRFQWQNLTLEGMTISWYNANPAVMGQLLREGLDSLSKSEKLLGVRQPLTVNVIIYSSIQDMYYALPWNTRNPDPKLPTLGLQVSPTTLLLLGQQPDPARTLSHELSHITVRQGIGYIPSWLDEGLALMAEGDLAPEQATALEQAVAANKLLSLRSMTEVPDPRDPHQVWLFYGQAYSVTRFIIESKGVDKLRALMAEIKDGKDFDKALTDVYGWTTDSLEWDWRDSMGLPPGRPDNSEADGITLPKDFAVSPSQPFLAMSLLAAFGLAVIFLFPVAILWLFAAIILVSRRRYE